MVSFELSLLGDLDSVIRTVAALLGLGLVMAFSPTTFGIEVGAVEQNPRPRTEVLIIAGAVALAATIWAGLFLLLAPGALQSWWSGQAQPIIRNHWLELVVGLLLVLGGVLQWRRAARPRRPHRTSTALVHPGRLFAMVLAESMISTSGPATMYLVVRVLDDSTPVLWIPDYAVFLVGLAVPYVIVAVAITSFPPAARHAAWAVERIGRLDLRRPVAAASTLAGVIMIGWAVVRLAQTSS